MSRGGDLLAHFAGRTPAAIDLLERLVAIDSPTSDAAAVNRMAAAVGAEFRAAGARVDRLPQRGAGDALAALFGPAPAAGDLVRAGDPAGAGAPAAPRDPILLLGHLDTVWPAGEAARRPFRVEGGFGCGPGAYDMKAGIVLCLLLARAARDGAFRPGGPVAVFLSGDEETGSPVSRPRLEEAARRSRCVLGLEPPMPDGGAKTVRKGVGRIVIEVEGAAAHAGIDPSRGVNAIEEIAAQILAVKLLHDPASGTTLHAGLVSGGVARNVVAPRARAEIDVRVPTPEAWARVESAVLNLRPRDPKAGIRVEATLTHPPMVRTGAVDALYGTARAAAAEVGFPLGQGSTGGGSDGSWCAALGVPVLDGLGVEGEGAHAEAERVRLDRLAPRAAFLALLIERLSEAG